MRSFRAAVAAVLCLFAFPALAEMPKELVQLQQQVLSLTVRIDHDCSGQVIWSKRDEKSGNVRTLILTAAHCVPKGDTKLYDVAFPVYDKRNRLIMEQVYPARYFGKSIKADVALLELKDKDTWFERTVKIAPADVTLYQGEDIISAGYPRARELTITSGLLGPIVETNELNGVPREYYRGTPNLAGGSSGGGLYHKNAAGDWELIGINSATIPASFFMSLFLPVEQIAGYLRVAVPEVVGAKPPPPASK